MHIDFVIYQFARNIIRKGFCNITLHAEIEYIRNNDLLYSLNVNIYGWLICKHTVSILHSLYTGRKILKG